MNGFGDDLTRLVRRAFLIAAIFVTVLLVAVFMLGRWSV